MRRVGGRRARGPLPGVGGGEGDHARSNGDVIGDECVVRQLDRNPFVGLRLEVLAHGGARRVHPASKASLMASEKWTVATGPQVRCGGGGGRGGTRTPDIFLE